MAELRVKVVIDTHQLHWWATKHRDLGHESVAIVLTAAADHYESIGDTEDPPPPGYPAGLDDAELQKWIDWHIDHGPVGVAHTLFAAAEPKRRA
ncbi:MAG: hypothetical protein WCE30_06770 [Mycobacterium sp.]